MKIMMMMCFIGGEESGENWDRSPAEAETSTHRQSSITLHWYSNSLARCKVFLPARHYASAGLRDSNVSVCPSRAGIVSKRRKLASWFLHHLVAPRLYFSIAKFHHKILRGSSEMGPQRRVGGKIQRFSIALSVNISKTVADTAKVTNTTQWLTWPWYDL